MTIEEMAALFETHQDEYLNRGDDKLCDLNAFLKLQDLAPVDGDMISAAEHDKFRVTHDEEEVAKAITEEDVIFLLRCGCLYDEGEGFWFFS